MAPTVEVLDDARLVLGEGPHWDAEAQALYYVDIVKSTVIKYDARTEKITRVHVDMVKGASVSAVIPVAGTADKFVIGYGTRVAVLTWDGVSSEPANLEVLLDAEPGSQNRFNDGKTDSKGRLWIGTMGPETAPGVFDSKSGSLYSLSEDGKSAKSHVTGIGISNGLAWSSDDKVFYYIDSLAYTVDAFDYDIETGALSNRRVVFDLKKNQIEGLPDGMTIDTEDKLWVATFEGSAVYRVDPKTGSVLQRVELPTSKITSVAWGGPNLDELYVTSASLYEKEDHPHAGRTFKITGLGVSGRPGVPAKL